MKFEKIFWLDDNPNFFEYVRLAGLDTREVLPRVALAYDFESGAEIVRAHDFDLYVLDGDFPNRVTPERRRELDAYMQQVRAGNFRQELRFQAKPVVWNNFKRFFEKGLSTKAGRVIGCSMSKDALANAFLMGLPMYSKSVDTAERNRDWAEMGARLCVDKVDQEKLAEWETGGFADFALKYLS